MSSGPSAAAASSTKPVAPSGVPTSATRPTTCAPSRSACSAATAASTRSAFRPQTATSTPSRTSARADPSPRPADAAATAARRPAMPRSIAATLPKTPGRPTPGANSCVDGRAGGSRVPTRAPRVHLTEAPVQTTTTTTAEPRDRNDLVRFREYRQTRDRALRNRLIEDHRWLALHCAKRFANKGEPLDDLVQVAMLGVLKAVERYDPEYGATFATFAVPTITGELRRHFRDTTWAVHVPRRAKDMQHTVKVAVDELGQFLGRSPTVDEIANHA